MEAAGPRQQAVCFLAISQFFSSSRSSGAADLGPHLTWEPTHPSLSGMDLGWSEGLLDPFVFANNRWVTSAPEGPPVPGYHLCPLPMSSSQLQTSIEVGHQAHRAVRASSLASESCKKALEQIFQGPAGARGLRSTARQY